MNPNDIPNDRKDYSKLIDADQFSIRATWAVFRHTVIPKDAPRIQVEEMEKAYYGGFTECFKVMTDYAAGLPERKAARLFDAIMKEGNAWVDKMLKAHRGPHA